MIVNAPLFSGLHVDLKPNYLYLYFKLYEQQQTLKNTLSIQPYISAQFLLSELARAYRNEIMCISSEEAIVRACGRTMKIVKACPVMPRYIGGHKLSLTGHIFEGSR